MMCCSTKLSDFRYYSDGGTVLHGEPPVQSRLQQFQHSCWLPPVSAVSSQGSEGRKGPPLLLECFPLPRILPFLDASVDSSGINLLHYITVFVRGKASSIDM